MTCIIKVIDDEKKMKDLEEKKKIKNKKKLDAQQDSTLDIPYPEGVRKRSRIRTYQIKEDELDEDRNLLETGKDKLRDIFRDGYHQLYTEVYLWPYQKSIREFFCKNS